MFKKAMTWHSNVNKQSATIALIQIVGSESIQSQLLDNGTVKKDVWLRVAEQMVEKGFDVGPDGGKICHQKWRNLKRAYVVYVTRPGNRMPPPYMVELQKALETTKRLLKALPCGAAGGKEDTPEDEGGVQPAANQSVRLAEVLAIVGKLDVERRQREAEREAREERRFSRLETLLREQNQLTEKLTDALLQVTGAKKRKLAKGPEAVQCVPLPPISESPPPP